MQKSGNSMKPLMKCGHTANAVTAEGKPCCVIYAPSEDSYTILLERPELTGRLAKCSDCGAVTDSKWRLPFFEYKPDKEYDEYYCGCYGWD